MWIDVKTGKPLGKTSCRRALFVVDLEPAGFEISIVDVNSAYNHETGQNAAWDAVAGQWIDTKTLMALSKTSCRRALFVVDLQPVGFIISIGDVNSAFDPETGQNAAWVPDQKPAGGIQLGVAATALAIGAAAIGGAIGIFVALNHGGGTSGHTATPAAVVQPAQSPSALPSATAGAATGASPSPTRRLLTGTYSGKISVADDPNGHAQYIGPMPTVLQVNIGRNTTTRVVTLQVSGAAPFIPVTSVGNYNESTGGFSAAGSGTVTSRQIPVTATLGGTLIGGNLSANLTYTGTPNGPITYDVHMTKIAGP